jgi:tetratricopeptide (TPR) repeat protein/TolB-like protein
MALLWPEADVESGQNSLRVALHALRRALGPETLISEGSVIRLDTQRVSVDVVEFESALDDARLEHAVALYRGPFLDGFHLSSTDFDQWMEAERSRLQQQCVTAIRSLAISAAAAGAHRDAATWWRRAAALDPYDSATAAELMRALGHAGDVAGAVRYAQTHVALLADLDVQTPAALVELESDLREGRFKAGAPPVRTGPPEPIPPPTEPVRPTQESAAGVTQAPRPRSGRRVSLILGASAFVAILLFAVSNSAVRAALRFGTSDGDAARVIVIPFDNLTEDTLLDPLGRLAADWLTQRLQRTGLVQVIDPQAAWRLRADVDSTQTGRLQGVQLREVAGAARAGTVVWGSVTRQDSQVVLRAEILAADDSKVLRAVEPVLGSLGDVGSALEVLHQRVSGAVASLIDQRIASEVPSSSTPPTYDAYREFADGIDLYLSAGHFMPEGVTAAIERFERAALLDTTFVTARLWAARLLVANSLYARGDSIIRSLIPLRDRLPPAERAGLDAFIAGINEDAEAELLALRRAAQLAPQSIWAHMAADAALTLGRPRVALAELSVFGPAGGWLKHWAGYWTLQMTAYHQLGQYQKQLELARRDVALAAPDRRPAHGPHPFLNHELFALAALGRLSELDRRMEALSADYLARGWTQNLGNAYLWVGEELMGHGHPELAQKYFARCIELAPQERLRLGCMVAAGQYERVAAVLAARPIGRPNRSWDALAAVVSAKLGRREDAVRHQARMEQSWPRDRITYAMLHFEQARIAALLGDRQRAVEYLRQEPHRGALFDVVHKSTDFARFRDDPFIAALRRPLK